MLRKLAVIKHPSFAEEREWRWLRQLGRHDCRQGTTVHFRPTNNGPAPFIAHAFPADALVDLVIGPGPQAEVSALGVRDMLHCHEFGSTEVRMSEIPLRW